MQIRVPWPVLVNTDLDFRVPQEVEYFWAVMRLSVCEERLLFLFFIIIVILNNGYRVFAGDKAAGAWL